MAKGVQNKQPITESVRRALEINRLQAEAHLYRRCSISNGFRSSFSGEIDRLLESENQTISPPISEVTESTPLQDSTLLHELIVETPPEVPVSEPVQRRAWVETVLQEGESPDYVELNEKIQFTVADIQEESVVISTMFFIQMKELGLGGGGQQLSHAEINALKGCMDACSLFELKQKDCFYTWNNKHVYSRIDWLLVNTEWLDVFTESEAAFLPQGVSDHPLISVKRRLKEFNNTHFREIEVHAKQDLENIQMQLDALPGDEGLLAKEHEVVLTYKAKADAVKVFYIQKMKANWWKYGDCNSTFFHSWVKKRVQTNRVYAVQEQNGKTVHRNDVAETFVDYYKDLLGTGSHAAGDIQDHIIAVGPVLHESHKIELTAPVMDGQFQALKVLIRMSDKDVRFFHLLSNGCIRTFYLYGETKFYDTGKSEGQRPLRQDLKPPLL
ncbi:hypothetical protein Cgig2_010182 [Carnegiea gigantea]|uniref:Uncharacterized protein n=1 Tax=Carnegiea gigantea TaxID=171969 RepID=A0A9Q1GJA3_9CARY|nr:hypothetical protein Cgig2_010182 [Carnegiea gigantea]